MTDHRRRPRRRGDVLNSAIFEATLDELAEVGYAKLTMERVAARAGASKARFIGAGRAAWAGPRRRPSSCAGPHRHARYRQLARRCPRLYAAAADLLAGPGGEALRGLLGDALTDPSRTLELRKRSRGTGHRVMQEIVRRAVERGEINTDTITPRRLDVAQAMLREQFLFHGPPIPDAVIVEIVDEIVLPLRVASG